MIKLKEVISQLNNATYNTIQDNLVKTKASKFLFVLNSYREGKTRENDIVNDLKLSVNSFYTLKSRLYDRIQDQLTSELNISKSDIYTQLEQVHNICYNSSHELAVTFLDRLEKNLIAYEMHSELLIVYSALKKLHHNTSKYFHYSQLYNKSVAFWLSIEKAHDILSDFNLILGQYDFSKSPEQLTKLKFLREEINHHCTLNSSKQLEIIKNIIDVQLSIFCNTDHTSNIDISDLLKDTIKKIDELPESSIQKKWDTILHFLSFEFYIRNGKTNKADEFYEKTNLRIHNLLLFSNVSLVAKFLTSKINYISSKNPAILKDTQTKLLCNNTMHSKIQLGIYNAMIFYYSNDVKKAINTLNALLTNFSFKDHFHIYMEIKFTIAFMYLKLNEFDMIESLISGIYKKIKTDKLDQYSNALDLIKFFKTFTHLKTSNATEIKRRELLMLFFAKNKNENELLYHLQTELQNTYIK